MGDPSDSPTVDNTASAHDQKTPLETSMRELHIHPTSLDFAKGHTPLLHSRPHATPDRNPGEQIRGDAATPAVTCLTGLIGPASHTQSRLVPRPSHAPCNPHRTRIPEQDRLPRIRFKQGRTYQSANPEPIGRGEVSIDLTPCPR